MKIDVDRRITIEMTSKDLDGFKHEVYALEAAPSYFPPSNAPEFADKYPYLYRIIREAT